MNGDIEDTDDLVQYLNERYGDDAIDQGYRSAVIEYSPFTFEWVDHGPDIQWSIYVHCGDTIIFRDRHHDTVASACDTLDEWVDETSNMLSSFLT